MNSEQLDDRFQDSIITLLFGQLL